MLSVLERISDVIAEEEKAHSDLTELFVSLVEDETTRNDPASMSAMFSAMQSFDKTKQRVDYLTRLAKHLTVSEKPEDTNTQFAEVGMPPVEDDAIWLNSLSAEPK